MTVITKSKDLCSLVLEVTVKSPKKFRFTLVTKMQNITLDIIELIYLANEVFVNPNASSTEKKKQYSKRIELMHRTLTKIKILDYMSMLAREQDCILPKQYMRISKLISDCQNLVGAWIKSDKKRFGY